MSSLLSLLTLSLAPLATGVVPPAVAPVPSTLDLEEIEGRLEFEPDSPELLLEAARASLEAGDPDRALWYAGLGLDAAGEERSLRKVSGELEELSASIELPEVGADALLDEFGKELFSLAQTFQRRKYYANAVDVLVRCRGTRFERDAEKKLEKIYKNSKAVEQIVASGIPIPEKPGRLGPEEIARMDAKHQDWDDHYEFETKLYTVLTNAGHDLGSSALQALEQMNQLYREVYQYKTRGGTMRRAVVHIYSSKKEFQEVEEITNPGVQGFLSIYENRVAAFDPRSNGGSLADLWETLFHEASHQFTRAIFPGTIPAWFNEGTACYFEGTKILPSGSVRTNLVPPKRLKSLLSILEVGRPSLEQVLSYFQDGSYPGSYYPVGWGLIYFVQNYEDEDSERIYLPIYAEYIETYKGGGAHDSFARWKQYFIDEAAVPGIDSFEAWKDHWEEWIRALAEIEFGGPEQADVLIARARKQRGNGKLERARESYEWALRKRPLDPAALFEVAQIRIELEQEDAAIFDLRQLLELIGQQPDPVRNVPGYEEYSWGELRDAVMAQLSEIDENVSKGVASVGSEFAAGMLQSAEQLVDADFPLAAMRLISDASAVLGGDARLDSRLQELQEEGGRSVARWRRLVIDEGLEQWSSRTGAKASPPDSLDLRAEGPLTMVHRGVMPERYRFEATIELVERGDNPAFGLVFGSNNETGLRTYVVLPTARAAGVYEFRSTGPEEIHDLGSVTDEDADIYEFAIEVDGEQVTFFLNGEQQGKPGTFKLDEVRGEVGIVLQGASAMVRGLRVRS